MLGGINMPGEPILEHKRSKFNDTSLLTEIAEALSMSVSELENKPFDIQQLLIHTYLNRNNQADIQKQLLAIISPNYETERAIHQDNIKNNPLKTVEELIEGNYNSIDGIINNEPPKKDKQLNISIEQIKANSEMVQQKEYKTTERSREELNK